MFTLKTKTCRIFLITLCLALAGGCATPAAAPDASPATEAIPLATLPPPTDTPLPPTDTPVPPTPTPEPSPTPTRKPMPAPVVVPFAQGCHLMAYDSESDRVILVTGDTCTMATAITCTWKPFTNTWVFAPATKTWQKMPTTGPMPAMKSQAIAYDSQSDRVIMFLGHLFPDNQDKLIPVAETWAYDYNTNTWTNMQPEGGPFGLNGERMVYDAESDRIILYGGIRINDAGKSRSTDTWAYDYDSNTWTDMQPAGEPIQGHNYFAMSYDAGADRVIAWLDQLERQPDTKIGIYDYNSNTWEIRQTKMAPDPQSSYNAMVYDPATRLNILFGGSDPMDGTPSNLTWGYDYAANIWRKLPAKNPPSPRSLHAMVYHPPSGLIILFGGADEQTGKLNNETWFYNPLALEWSMLQMGP